MGRATRWWWAAGLVAVCWPVEAQAPRASPSPASRRRGQTSVQQPTAPVGPRTGTAAGVTDSAGVEGSGGHEGGLKGVRALEIQDGRARLVLGGSERTISPGSVIGTDTVKSITPGRIVLRRQASEAAGGEAIVIVTFDRIGRTRVQVFAARDPTARVPATVK